MKLPMLPPDKANHALYGAALFTAGYLVAGRIGGVVLCAAAAVGKEIYDRVSRTGTSDRVDAVATLGGGALVLLATLGGVLHA